MMQTARILQAVVLLLILAMAASCATSNAYVNKLFKPRNAPEEEVAKKEPRPIKFLEFDSTDQETEAWVKDWINSNDKQDSSVVGMKPIVKSDSIVVVKATAKKDTAIVMPVKPEPIPEEPVARTTTNGGVRNKAKRD